MKYPYKMRVEKTKQGEVTKIPCKYSGRYTFILQSFLYDNDSPNTAIHLIDGDGDEFMFKIPGQAEPKASTPQFPLTVKLPISYYDERGECNLIIWGELEKIGKFDSGM